MEVIKHWCRLRKAGRAHPPGEFNFKSPYSVVSASWLNNTFRTGYHYRVDDVDGELDVDDLPPLSDLMDPDLAAREFRRWWAVYERRGYHHFWLLRAVLKLVPLRYYFFCAAQSVLVAYSPLQAYFLGHLLTAINDGDTRTGCILAVVMFVWSLVWRMADGAYWGHGDVVRVRVGAALSNHVYVHSLSLAGAGVMKGNANNLLANDPDKVARIFHVFNDSWMMIFRVLITIVFLFGYVGSAGWGAIGVAILLAPINYWGMVTLNHLAMDSSSVSDRRIAALTEILTNIMTVKLFAWEDSSAARIDRIRRTEMKLRKKLQLTIAAVMFIILGSTPLMSLSVLAIYALGGHSMDAVSVFPALTLINNLMWPMLRLPECFTALAQANVALGRLNHFFRKERVAALCSDRVQPLASLDSDDSNSSSSGSSGREPGDGDDGDEQTQQLGGIMHLALSGEPRRPLQQQRHGDAVIELRGATFAWPPPPDPSSDGEESDDDEAAAASAVGKAGRRRALKEKRVARKAKKKAIRAKRHAESQERWRNRFATDARRELSLEDSRLENVDDGAALHERLRHPVLRNVSLSVRRGELLAVIGSVGAGKSALVQALLGELQLCDGSMAVAGGLGKLRVSYVPQQAWIRNATLRANVCMANAFEQGRYDDVVDCCSLRRDISILPKGDFTEIGEKGVNLSGGQKQRVSMARAVYNDADVYVLDDPLSAVDAHVGKAIFEDCLKGRLEGRTRVLVTHQLQYLPMCDRVVVVEDGQLRFVGTYAELQRSSVELATLTQHGVGDDDDGDDDADKHGGGGGGSGSFGERGKKSSGGSSLMSPRGSSEQALFDRQLKRSLALKKSRELMKTAAAPSSASAAAPAARAQVQLLQLDDIGGDTAAAADDVLESDEREEALIDWRMAQVTLPRTHAALSLSIDASDVPIASPTPPPESAGLWVESLRTVAGGSSGVSLSAAASTAASSADGVKGGAKKWHTGSNDAITSLSSIEIQQSLDSSITRSGGGGDDDSSDDERPRAHTTVAALEAGRATVDEEKEVGAVGWHVYRGYFAAGGGKLFYVVMFLTCVAYQGAYLGTLRWLSHWTDNAPPTAAAVAASTTTTTTTAAAAAAAAANDELWGFLGVYVSLALATAVLSLARQLFFAFMGVRAARTLHERQLRGVLGAPMSFFFRTPTGRITNRFSADQEKVDTWLPDEISDTAYSIVFIVSSVLLAAYMFPLLLVAFVPLMVLFGATAQFYRCSAREIGRLGSMAISPVFAQYSETLAGLSSIRAYGLEQHVVDEMNERLGTRIRNDFAAYGLQRWVWFYSNVYGATFIFVLTLALVLLLPTSGTAAVLLWIGSDVVFQLTLFTRTATNLEKDMNRVERILEYKRLAPEEVRDSPAVREKARTLDAHWPSRGVVKFENVSLRYGNASSELALREVSFKIPGGRKVGVVGRTGAGKSTLATALFRLVEPCGGRVLIDGVDTRNVPLHELRSRLAVIPQDPALFSGSIRSNLDPTERFDDADIWQALERVSMREHIEAMPEQLQSGVGDSGSSLSVGQRQLLCMARALLKDAKVLVLDEATASIDTASDNVLQATIRTCFADRTLITVAHRLTTILDYDYILVMEQGAVAEFGRPKALLRNGDSLFASLVAAHEEQERFADAERQRVMQQEDATGEQPSEGGGEAAAALIEF